MVRELLFLHPACRRRGPNLRIERMHHDHMTRRWIRNVGEEVGRSDGNVLRCGGRRKPGAVRRNALSRVVPMHHVK